MPVGLALAKLPSSGKIVSRTVRLIFVILMACWKQAAPNDVAWRTPLNGIGGWGGSKRRFPTLNA